MLEEMHIIMATIEPYIKGASIIFSSWCIIMYIVWELNKGS